MLQKLKTWIKNPKRLSFISAPEFFVLIVIIGFGSFLAFKVPLGAGFDEETHLLRVWEMSDFEWIPNARLSKDMHFPAFYWDNSYRRQVIIEPIQPDFWKINADIPIDGNGYVEENLTTRSVYSPLLLLPQSLIMFLFGRVFNFPALTVLIAMRLLGMLCYALLAWLAVKLAPFGKWMWAIMVVAPMAIYQASTISTDTISNGIGFLFVSGCLLMAERKQIRWKEWLILVLLFFLLFAAKLNLIILAVLPFIILTPTHFKMKRGFLWLGIAFVMLFLLEVGGWNILAYTRLDTAQSIANPIGQVMHILTHPFSTIMVLFADLKIHLLTYIQGWIADLGYGYWGPHWFVYITYLVAILFTYMLERSTHIDKRIRFGLFFTFGLSFIGTLLSLYILFNPVGSSEIQAVHGRYFTTIIPLLVLGLIGIPFKSVKLDLPLLTRISVGITLFSLLIFTVGGYLAYYRPCGAQFYRLGSCYMPVYKNWSPDTVYFQPISPENSLTQWIMPNCSGMRTLRIWIDATGTDPNEKTEFILNDEENDVIVVDEEIPNADLPNKDWFNLNFPINWQSSGNWYTLTIQNPPGDLNDGIRVASSIRPEYIDAPLFQNGSEIENDMIFQYGCISGWEKLIPRVITLINNR
jgi:uncharacterized membrane protein